MGYLSNFNIGASVDSNCSYIEITDNNSYPVTLDGSPRTRANLGIAVFWSLDDFSSVDGSDLTNGTTWFINDPITGIYYMRAYIVPVWSAGSWAANSIVFEDGYFYHNSSGGATSEVPGTHASDWTRLTSSSHATFETHLYSASVINYGYYDLTQISTCVPYTISKTGAGKYTIDYQASSNNKTLTITYYNGDALTTPYSETLTAGTTSFDVDISAEGDGVFIFTIEETGEETYQYIVYEISNLQACANSITQQILSLCEDDPCLDSCLNTDQAAEVSLRNELNKIIMLYMNIILKINVESVTYLNIFTIDQTRQSYVNEVGDLVEKVDSIVSSCGACSN